MPMGGITRPRQYHEDTNPTCLMPSIGINKKEVVVNASNQASKAGRWTSPRQLHAAAASLLRIRVDLELLRQECVTGERLARVDEVQVAALDGGLGFQFPWAAAHIDHDRRPVLDHLERPLRTLQLRDQVGPDPLRLAP